ncbi:unnamed protein product, partial [Hermetia illucens]
DSTPSFYGLH